MNHAIGCRTVAEIQEKVIKQSRRHGVSRFFHSRNNKDMIVGWKSDLNRILVVFNVCSMSPCLVATDFTPPPRPSSM